MGVCINCGQQLDEGTLFCPYCGTPQAQAPAQPTANEPAQPQVPQSEPVQPAQPEPQPQNQAVYPTFPEAQFSGAAPQQPQFNQAGLEQAYGQQAAFQQGYGQQAAFPQQGYPQQAAPKAPGSGFLSKIPKPVLIIVPIIIVLAIIAAIVFSNMRGASSYKGAVKNFFHAMDEGDTDGMFKAMFPKSIEKAAKKELGGDMDDMMGMMGGFMGMIDVKNEKITDKEHASKSDISDFEEELQDSVGGKVKIQDMYYLTVEVEISMSGMADLYNETEEMDMVAYKTGGRWYVFPE